MPKLTITIDVPNGIYCGFPGLIGEKCHMCFRTTKGEYLCAAYWTRLQCDVSGPLKTKECEKLTDKTKYPPYVG